MHSPLVIFTVLATALTVATALPAAAAQPKCTSVPEIFWQCVSDCLYIKCRAGEEACVKPCDAACKNEYVPDCDPGIW
ncbi:hypothetical protein B0H67DRAFT_642785 [Lasiosphaeris hirsuta]|uniref:Uncharacterized protein n=1 Tax=Lasiosphaeris hirsuta TaxID=260670 RepID=A0AA40AP49_9PEZI|nr:hypothetical protein B0H67DRAFT_642785 [Lasiosphaeris hirsuta]